MIHLMPGCHRDIYTKSYISLVFLSQWVHILNIIISFLSSKYPSHWNTKLYFFFDYYNGKMRLYQCSFSSVSSKVKIFDYSFFFIYYLSYQNWSYKADWKYWPIRNFSFSLSKWDVERFISQKNNILIDLEEEKKWEVTSS